MMIASNTFCANKHIKLMNLDYIMHGTAVFLLHTVVTNNGSNNARSPDKYLK